MNTLQAEQKQIAFSTLNEQAQQESKAKWDNLPNLMRIAKEGTIKLVRDGKEVLVRRGRSEAKRRARRRIPSNELGRGYNGLPEPYLTYFKVAVRFAVKAMLQDREDLLDEIIIGLWQVGERKASKGEQFTEIAQIRIAEHIKDHYWYNHYSYYYGLDCQHCSKAERAKCRYDWEHTDKVFTDCRKAIRLESLNEPVTDEEGNVTEQGDLIADDNALDLNEWLDAKLWLISAPFRLKAIAIKKESGTELTLAERKYLAKLRKRYQLSFDQILTGGGNDNSQNGHYYSRAKRIC